uniref:Uncharacterized protein n=1 Tax=Sander lucioperca TaxID=283035 RepID=A0A8C9YFV0_SANLU
SLLSSAWGQNIYYSSLQHRFSQMKTNQSAPCFFFKHSKLRSHCCVSLCVRRYCNSVPSLQSHLMNTQLA